MNNGEHERGQQAIHEFLGKIETLAASFSGPGGANRE